MLMYATVHWGCMDRVRESVMEADWEKNPLPQTGDSNPCQYCACAWLFSWMLYQLNHSCPILLKHKPLTYNWSLACCAGSKFNTQVKTPQVEAENDVQAIQTTEKPNSKTYITHTHTHTHTHHRESNNLQKEGDGTEILLAVVVFKQMGLQSWFKCSDDITKQGGKPFHTSHHNGYTITRQQRQSHRPHPQIHTRHPGRQQSECALISSSHLGLKKKTENTKVLSSFHQLRNNESQLQLARIFCIMFSNEPFPLLDLTHEGINWRLKYVTHTQQQKPDMYFEHELIPLYADSAWVFWVSFWFRFLLDSTDLQLSL